MMNKRYYISLIISLLLFFRELLNIYFRIEIYFFTKNKIDSSYGFFDFLLNNLISFMLSILSILIFYLIIKKSKLLLLKTSVILMFIISVLNFILMQKWNLYSIANIILVFILTILVTSFPSKCSSNHPFS